MKNSSKMWFSNCIIEAIKAKIHNWKNVEIIYQPGFMNELGFHLLWREKDKDLFYDFVYHKGETWICKFLFKGSIRCLTREEHNKALNISLTHNIKKYGKRMHFTPYQTLYEGIQEWQYYFIPIDLNFLPSHWLMYTEKNPSGEVEIKYVSIDSLTLVPVEQVSEEQEGNTSQMMNIKEFMDNPHVTGYKFLMEEPIMERV